MSASVNARALRGRSRFGLIDGVKKTLSKRWLSVESASENAGSKYEWREIVKTQL